MSRPPPRSSVMPVKVSAFKLRVVGAADGGTSGQEVAPKELTFEDHLRDGGTSSTGHFRSNIKGTIKSDTMERWRFVSKVAVSKSQCRAKKTKLNFCHWSCR